MSKANFGRYGIHDASPSMPYAISPNTANETSGRSSDCVHQWRLILKIPVLPYQWERQSVWSSSGENLKHEKMKRRLRQATVAPETALDMSSLTKKCMTQWPKVLANDPAVR